jgi:DNA-binding response OmpR family regulator
MSGFDVLSEIRKDPALKMTPVILLTNLGEKSDVRRGLELGATDYLIKAHFLPSEVVTKIKRYLKLPADAIG